MRALLLWVALSVTGAAQITDLASTADGGQIFFSTALRLRGTRQGPYAKMFRISAGGPPELLVQREFVYPEGRPNTSSFYRPTGTAVSSDGSRIAYTLQRECYGGSGCVSVEVSHSVIQGRGLATPVEFDGRVQLSLNGRFALRYGSTSLFPQSALLDLDGGPNANLTALSARMEAHALTETGQVLARDSSGLLLWSARGNVALRTTEPAAHQIVSAFGTVVVYQTAQSMLRAYAIATGTDSVIGEGFSPVLSSDGTWLLYRAALSPEPREQVWLVHLPSRNRRMLADLTEGIGAATLTPDANAAFITTASNRLLRMDLPSATVQVLVPETPFLQMHRGAAVPGSALWLEGSGLAGVKSVTLNDRAIPLLAAAGNRLTVQIPFDTPAQTYTLSVGPNPSPFEAEMGPLTVSLRDPQFIRFGWELPVNFEADIGPVTVHQDFTTLVSALRPALPAEIVHLYLTGLGSVSPAVESGKPTSLEPLTRLMNPLDCVWQSVDANSATTARPAEVWFAGLAPGMMGVYQLSVRIPADVPANEGTPGRTILLLRCGESDSSDNVAGISVRANR